MRPDDLRVYFIMGSQDCPPHTSPVSILKEAIQGGITSFQFREKNSTLTMAETLELGHALRDECRRGNIPFIVNDRVDLALLLEADGVHVGQQDLPVPEVKKLINEDMFIGVSAHTVEEAQQAILAGANYLGVGPFASTHSKRDTEPELGIEGIAALCSQINGKLPVVAIGGITASSAGDIINCGAEGVAVISAICSASSPQAAAESMRQAVQNGLEVRRYNE